LAVERRGEAGMTERMRLYRGIAVPAAAAAAAKVIEPR
jgi:hypothetical protein